MSEKFTFYKSCMIKCRQYYQTLCQSLTAQDLIIYLDENKKICLGILSDKQWIIN